MFEEERASTQLATVGLEPLAVRDDHAVNAGVIAIVAEVFKGQLGWLERALCSPEPQC